MSSKKILNRRQFWGRIWPKILRTVKKNGLFLPGERILVALSGGPDSVCLAHALWLLSRKWNLRLHLVHFHHGLRPGADRDALWTQKWARQFQLPLTIRKLPVPATAQKRRKGLEEAGRTLRYRSLLQLAKKLGCVKIATGHTLDDQAETVLWSLLRGRDSGISAIPVRRPIAPGARIQVIRPLLNLRKGEVFQYLKSHGLRYRTDPSNRSKRFLRNRIRHELLPLLETFNPNIRERLIKCLPMGLGPKT